MTPFPFLIPLTAGVFIGAFAMWAAHHPDRLVQWVHGSAHALATLWDDTPPAGRGPLPGRHLHAVDQPGRCTVTARTSTLGRGHVDTLRPPFQWDDRLDGGHGSGGVGA